MIILKLIGGTISEGIEMETITSITMMVVAGLMIFLFIRSKFYKREVQTENHDDDSSYNLSKDVLLQPIKKDGRQSQQLPFSNYNPQQLYLWIFLLLITVFLLCRVD